MSIPSQLPPTRANVAAQSGGKWLALYDCLECAHGVYRRDGRCSCCGAPAPPAIRSLMASPKNSAVAA